MSWAERVIDGSQYVLDSDWHRMGIIACHCRAAEWRHKDIELAAHDLLQRMDRRNS